jgi:hypothetical protein
MSSDQTTPNAITQIRDGFIRCLSLWRDVKASSQIQKFMMAEVYRDIAMGFEAALQSGVIWGKSGPMVRLESKRAFEYGDGTTLPNEIL